MLFAALAIGGLAFTGLAFLIDRDWWTFLFDDPFDEDPQPEDETLAVAVGCIGVLALSSAAIVAGGMLL